MTAPATVRALGQRLGRDDPALPRSRWTQGWSVCPGPSAQTLDCPRPWEHTRVGVRVFRATIPGFRKGLPWERVGVRGLPRNHPRVTHRCWGARLFTLSKGRGRFGRLRPKPVKGLPVEATRAISRRRAARLGKEDAALSPFPLQSEGSSAQPPAGYAPVLGRPALHPLQGERQVRASSAETGEGSSGRGHARHLTTSCRSPRERRRRPFSLPPSE